MNQSNLWVLVGRLCQIILGLAILGCTIKNRHFFGNGNEFITYPAWMGAMISALGSIGIAGIEIRQAEYPQTRAYLVVLYTDFYALVLSITCFAFLVRDACEQTDGPYRFVAPAVNALICMGILAASTARSARIRWRCTQCYVQEPSNEVDEKQTCECVTHSQCCNTRCVGHQQPASEAVQGDEKSLSFNSSRPLSTTGTSETLGSASLNTGRGSGKPRSEIPPAYLPP